MYMCAFIVVMFVFIESGELSDCSGVNKKMHEYNIIHVSYWLRENKSENCERLFHRLTWSVAMPSKSDNEITGNISFMHVLFCLSATDGR